MSDKADQIDPYALSTVLYDIGTRLLTETMKSDRLPIERRKFLNSWAERLKAMAQWVWDQHEAGLLGSADIFAAVQLDIEVAKDLAERELIPT